MKKGMGHKAVSATQASSVTPYIEVSFISWYWIAGSMPCVCGGGGGGEGGPKG